ncbi:MAG: hypothetical protein HYR90_01495 [Candidatus Andersenbacteria bacterium]|nr:hypothetical protein [Candidatus Andersenbacteria bacterium]MBI3250832.1 hypothetical protein [Candidatus Andersenbacteria bacterium]
MLAKIFAQLVTTAVVVVAAVMLFSGNSSAAQNTSQLEIFFTDKDNNLKTASLADEKWGIDTVDNPGGAVGTSLSVVLDNQGASHLSYRDSRPGKAEYQQSDLRYATNSSGTWQDEEAFGTDGRIGANAIVVDAQGHVHIIFNHYPANDPSNGELLYANNSTGDWQVEEVSQSALINSGNIGIDASGLLHTVYQHNQQLVYSKRTGSNQWTSEVITSFGSRLPHVAFALDSDGQPQVAIVLQDENKLKFAKRGGDSWSIEDVTSWTNGGDQHVYLGLDTNDKAHLALTTGPGNGRGPHYITKSGNQWLIESVGAFITEPSYLSLGVTTDDTVHLTFATAYDNSPQLDSDRPLHYARRVDNQWIVDQVHEEGTVLRGRFPVMVTSGASPVLPDCFARTLGLYCANDPSPVTNPNVDNTSSSNEVSSGDNGGGGDSGGGGGGGGGNGGESTPAPVAKPRVLGIQTVKVSAADKAAPDFIPNQQVPVIVARLFQEVFGRLITPAESTYWKGRARSDKATETKLRGAMAWHQANGSTGAMASVVTAVNAPASTTNIISNKQVPAVVEQVFAKVFHLRVSAILSTYWKGRARTDKRTKSLLEGAMRWYQGKGLTSPTS